MILPDTSIWVDHFRSADVKLIQMLGQNQIVIHPWVVGELACGNLRDRKQTLRSLRELPEAVVAIHDEVLYLIERHKLMGKGIGYIDANLLVSAIVESHELWTNDLRLLNVAHSIGIPASISSRRN